MNNNTRMEESTLLQNKESMLNFFDNFTTSALGKELKFKVMPCSIDFLLTVKLEGPYGTRRDTPFQMVNVFRDDSSYFTLAMNIVLHLVDLDKVKEDQLFKLLLKEKDTVYSTLTDYEMFMYYFVNFKSMIVGDNLQHVEMANMIVAMIRNEVEYKSLAA